MRIDTYKGSILSKRYNTRIIIFEEDTDRFTVSIHSADLPNTISKTKWFYNLINTSTAKDATASNLS